MALNTASKGPATSVSTRVAAIVLENSVPTVQLRGNLEVEFTIAWNTLAVIGALIALDDRGAFV